jgi:protein SCO1/2
MRTERALVRRSFRSLCLLGLFIAGMPPAVGHEHMQQMPMAQALSGRSVYNLASVWTNQSGMAVALASLRGRPVVAAMVYTHCKDVCPLITEKMLEIGDKLPKQSLDQVRFVLFSLDWVRDTPAQLTKFAAQHHLDLKRWTLLHGDESAVRELAAVLGVSFYRDENGDFQHSIAIFLLDANGVISEQESDIQAPPARLVKSIRNLLAKGNQSR